MKRKNIIDRMLTPLPELESYYRVKRKHEYDSGKQLRAIKLREKFYPVFKIILRIDRCFRKQHIVVLSKKRKFKGKYIFACTHIWENDLENIYETIGRGCWWFVGDPGFMYKDISGLLLYLNGRIYADLPFREDCHIAYLRAVELLNKGGSLMIFPEGARNGTENLPVMKLFPGVARMAKETNTIIIPVAIEQYDKRFVINFGNEITPTESISEKELTELLRDELASLRWEIWSNHGIEFRKDLDRDYKSQYNIEFEKKLVPYDTLETNLRARYQSKIDIEYCQITEDLKRIKKR